MSEVQKADLEQRIKENQRKIEEISAFSDDPKINKVIRALQKQLAQDSVPIEFVGSGSPPLKCSRHLCARNGS